MAWKIERWLSDVFSGQRRIYEEYRDLPRRELAIVAACVLDIALAELISKRVVNNPRECEGFLGLDEDGRAPAGAFGARIQLALLLGIITDDDAAILRTVKNIRNKMAHRVHADFTSKEVKPLVMSLCDKWREVVKQLVNKGNAPRAIEKLGELRPYLGIMPEAGAGLLLALLCVYQAYFHRLSDLITRVDVVLPGSQHREATP